jgi:protein-tyrosine phosphatase
LVDVLVVCTANVARSPLFAARLQLEADARVGAGAVEVASAGVAALYGEPAASGSSAVCARWGVPLDGHQATPTSHHVLAEIPLVLTMELAHRRELTSRNPPLAARTFTVREFVAIVSTRLSSGSCEHLPPLDPAEVRGRLLAVARLADAHRPRWLSRRRADVPDPIGAGQPVYDDLADEFTAAAATIAWVLFGPDQR